ncbi:MAG TPA: ATP-binding cassette domain-containing protein [Gemmatimonadaceae bacterium]|jgi:iron complex transport system ATP-binding protein|nr:ATP-binding cassette domain-containing protein [Gemmatimonadaceae bacterium]
MIDVRGVTYRAGSTLILDDVSARFPTGRFNVILGPNGAGKSTLMRLATGLAKPTKGDVRYDDRALESFEPELLARTRAVLSQNIHLAFPLPVIDVAMMGRYPHYGRVPSERDREIVERALEMVGMTDKREQPYPTLSGGEQQKVQLARVLAQIWSDDSGIDGARATAGTPREHRYLFLDEPTTSLDVHYQIHLLDVARGLLERDCTIVAILHDLNVAFEYGDHFLLLDRGRVAREAERAADITDVEIERVFRVHARRLNDDGRAFWRFSL